MQLRWLAIGTLCAVVTMMVAAAAGEPRRHIDYEAQSGAEPAFMHLKAHPIVALTFDDLSAAGALPPGETRARIAATLASELRANHLKGVYGFVNADSLQNDADAQQALRIWLAARMNIGSHTWSHPSLNDLTAQAYEENIALNEPALASYGKRHNWHWFRYPFLEEGDTLAKREAVRSWLREHHYRIAQVTLNFEDYAWNDAYDRCLVKLDNADIDWLKQSYLQNAAEFIRLDREEERIAFGREIPNVLLLHETSFTTLMLPDLLNLLRQQGFRFASLKKVERNRAYRHDPQDALKDGGTLPNQYLNFRHLKYPPFTPEPFDKLNSICE